MQKVRFSRKDEGEYKNQIKRQVGKNIYFGKCKFEIQRKYYRNHQADIKKTGGQIGQGFSAAHSLVS
ncbi:hypothetical protein SBF1_2560004 [Candidatus Desulfosporosinus infrequens]|uniref:Uncharacterized protein n=1 Tax=Candidatus Desulfosporosinus infrequens TaxID=2043169 RepID=A0A2U3KQ46_9FIRM|nr:hypothetical protein SBF1_2560004 [Candidatus Desulfosporosinus infrequens]